MRSDRRAVLQVWDLASLAESARPGRLAILKADWLLDNGKVCNPRLTSRVRNPRWWTTRTATRNGCSDRIRMDRILMSVPDCARSVPDLCLDRNSELEP